MSKVLAACTAALVCAQSPAEEFTRADVCKAAIAIEMGRDTSTMKTEEDGNIPVISYVREDDLQRFVYRCKFNGNQVIWAAYFEEERSWGRWRDSAGFGDATIKFAVAGSDLLMKSDQSGAATFTKSQFK